MVIINTVDTSAVTDVRQSLLFHHNVIMGTNRVIEIPLKPITSTEQKILPSNFRETIENGIFSTC